MKPIKGILTEHRVLLENTDQSRELYNKSRFGNLRQNGSVELSVIEALYLLEKKRISIFDNRNKEYDVERFIKRAKRIEPNFWLRYSVFKDLRDKGYIVKTALKFGGDFRVYDRGIKPGEDHAKWIVFCVNEGSTLTWHEFAAKNRVAHSTKKRLLIAILDDEGDITYYEIAWKRL